MRLGISVTSVWGDLTPPRAFNRMRGRVAAARDAGLDSMSMGADHSAGPATYLQGGAALGALLEHWDPFRPAGCLFLTPMWNPVVLAEQIATLSAFLDTHFIVQTGLGSGDHLFAALGRSRSGLGSEFEADVELMRALLAGDTADAAHRGVSGARIGPIPLNRPVWWIGAKADLAVERAARIGDAWYAGPNLSPTDAERLLELYRNARVDGEGTAVLRKDVIVLNDGAEARRLGDELMAAGYRGMGEHAVAYGSVDDVTERLAAERDRGWDEVVVRCMTTNRDVALETIALCGEVRAGLQ